MQNRIDMEENAGDPEQVIFSGHDIAIQNNPNKQIANYILHVPSSPSRLTKFYSQLNSTVLQTTFLGMFSSGVTKGSQSLYPRTKCSILHELFALENHSSFLDSKKILIMTTPNHSFGLIPALLTSRRFSTHVYINIGHPPIDLSAIILRLKPEVIFAVPNQIRLFAKWIERGNREIYFLKTIAYAGSPLDKDLICFFEDRGIALCCYYGTTQTGVISINKNVSSGDPLNCGIVLKNHTIDFSGDQREIVILTSEGGKVFTGDQGEYQKGNLIVKGRLDTVVFKNGNKIDLVWLKNLIQDALEIENIQIRLEKNINDTSEIVCSIPIRYRPLHRQLFDKIKRLIPAYALPDRFTYV
ncbi:MAG: hypothetical protein C5B47_02415 [Verrucomicrobia bacterium]|nr:MAG: hypothetical protein C5B47_02415 [Verrucomicrobiota bacterium]